MDEPLLTPRQVDALLLLAEHGPAARATYTGPTVNEDTGLVVDVCIHSRVADHLLETGHLMSFGLDDQQRSLVALAPLGHEVAEKARPGVTAARRRAVERAAAEAMALEVEAEEPS